MISFFKRKAMRIPLLVCCILLVLYMAFLGGLYIYFGYHNNLSDISDLPYRTDIQPLVDRFGETINVDSCYWKADVESTANFGPSTYWMKGFIKISQEDLAKLREIYPMTKTDVDFDDGMSPDITGLSGFDWQYNRDLSREITGVGFIGEFYLDVENGIFYFDLESN